MIEKIGASVLLADYTPLSDDGDRRRRERRSLPNKTKAPAIAVKRVNSLTGQPPQLYSRHTLTYC